jgi:hypothetical protein
VSYNVYIGITSGTEVFLIKLGNVTIYVVPGLTNGQVYYFQVAANNSIIESDRSNERFATPAKAPNAPVLIATPGVNQVTLNWNQPSNGGSAITNYMVYSSTTSGNETFLFSPGNVTSYLVTGLHGGITYYFIVQAWNDVGGSAFSLEQSATTPPTAPEAPQALVATGNGFNVSLSWQVPPFDGGSGITSYRVYRSTAVTSWAVLANPGGLTFTDTNVVSGTTYNYRVAAVNGVGAGDNASASILFVMVSSCTKAVSYWYNKTVVPNGNFVTLYNSQSDNMTVYIAFQGLTQEILVRANVTGNGSGTLTRQFSYVAGFYVLTTTVQTGWLDGLVKFEVFTNVTTGILATKTFYFTTAVPSISSVKIDDKQISMLGNRTVDASTGASLKVTLSDSPNNHAYWVNATFQLVPMVDLSTLNIFPPSSRINMSEALLGDLLTKGMNMSQLTVGSFWQAGMKPAKIMVSITAINSLGIPCAGSFVFLLVVEDQKTPTVGNYNLGDLANQLLDPTKEYEVLVHVPVATGATYTRSVILFLATTAQLPTSSNGNLLAKLKSVQGVKNVTLALVSGDVWMGMIPAQTPGAKLYWAIYVANYAGNETVVTDVSKPLTYSEGKAQDQLTGGYVFLGLLAFGIIFAISYRVQQGVQTVKKAKKVTTAGKKAVAEKAAPGSGKKTPISKDIPTKICPICKARIGADLDECPYCHKKFDSI